MNSGGRTKTPNRLWLARKRSALGQKQVAYLLNHRTVDQVSRFEKGLRIPNLETALRLEIIYRTPLRVLFTDLYENLREDLHAKITKQTLKGINGVDERDEEGAGEFCTYADLLRMPSPAPAELLKVRRHVTRLMKRMAFL